MSKCENCQKYADCASGSGLTWPCGAYVPKAQAPTKIHTYHEMNETLKDILRRSKEPMNLYTLARIEELEARLKAAELLAAEMVVRHMDEPAPAPVTRFDRIRACTTPADMALELNKNGRRFCPMEYDRKYLDCPTPCGECITNWLNEQEA